MFYVISFVMLSLSHTVAYSSTQKPTFNIKKAIVFC